MRRIGVVAVVVLLGACSSRLDLSFPDIVVGGGPAQERSYDLSGFDGLRVEAGFTTTVTRGDSYQVTVRANEVILPYVDVAVDGSTLAVRLESGHSYSASILEAEIVMPDLAAVDASGGSHVVVEGFESDEPFGGMLSGGSRLEGSLVAGPTRLDLSGGSTVDIDGSGRSLELMASGGSVAALQAYAVADATVDISGGGEVMVAPATTLEVTASGGSRVYYAGDPDLVRVDTSGGGAVQPLSA